MAERALTRGSEPRASERPQKRILPIAVVVRWRIMPWWLRVVIVYAASRVVTTVLMLVLAGMQEANPWTGAHPAYAAFANIWDGRWYEIIAGYGYPSELPLTDDGHIGENAWAFMPGYPALVRVLMEVTGLQWSGLAVFVSVMFGLGAALLFHRLLRTRLDASTTLFAVTLFCFAPLSPILQVGYAESMYLFLLTLALLLLVRRRYGLLFPVVAVMALTRPSGLAFALALGLHVMHRWFTRSRDPFPAREMVASVSVTVFTGLMGLAWPAAAWIVTGSITAYTDTELAWRAPYIGYQELIPFTAWFQSGAWWLGSPTGYIVVSALIVGFGAALFLPAVRRLGVDLRFWVASYALYLLAVFFPQSSTFRLLTPLFPLLGALAQPRSRLYRTALVLVFVALQWGWLYICWAYIGYDWSPP
ncbi:hypothetical protein WJX64_02320 [Leifsonia sp. YIM 134122]|uniref:Integral membrane protein n=1 Tax=Leifsonia stereocauli TaxID=3134136 RepID=A0ABU9W062_9MICO